MIATAVWVCAHACAHARAWWPARRARHARELTKPTQTKPKPNPRPKVANVADARAVVRKLRGVTFSWKAEAPEYVSHRDQTNVQRVSRKSIEQSHYHTCGTSASLVLPRIYFTTLYIFPGSPRSECVTKEFMDSSRRRSSRWYLISSFNRIRLRTLRRSKELITMDSYRC